MFLCFEERTEEHWNQTKQCLIGRGHPERVPLTAAHKGPLRSYKHTVNDNEEQDLWEGFTIDQK